MFEYIEDKVYILLVTVKNNQLYSVVEMTKASHKEIFSGTYLWEVIQFLYERYQDTPWAKEIKE